MKRYFKTIQMRMFQTYAGIIILMVAALGLFINRFVFAQFRDNAFAASLSMAEAQSSFLDQEIEKMDSLALGMLCSFVIKDYLNEIAEPRIDESRLEEKQRDVSKQLASLLAPYFAVQQIMLHDFKGNTFTSYNGYCKDNDISRVGWYEDVMAGEGLMYLTVPYAGDDPAMNSDITNSDAMISLCRTAYDNYRIERGIVEVKQYEQKIFRNLNTLFQEGRYQNICVINGRGDIIYQADRAAELNSREIIGYAGGAGGLTPVLHETDKTFVSSRRSDYSGLTLVLIQSRAAVMRSAVTFLRILSFSALAVMAAALIISYFAARQITAPINTLRMKIHRLDTNNLMLPDEGEEDSGLIEIDDLNRTFNAMGVKLKESIDQQILAHRQEAQYKMLALQSQMNPHFLYNSLAMISAMAEEKRTEEISYTCRNLSSMLRYAASGKDNMVSLETELAHTREYLETSKLRFREKLLYEINIPREILDVTIPKLSIQPLVENSIKYCSCNQPPWNIRIEGGRKGGGWYVKVRDNGKGISDEALAELSEKINSIEEEKKLPSLELDGMGLLNVYIRLSMLYGEKLVFHIDRGKAGGTEIAFGREASHG